MLRTVTSVLTLPRLLRCLTGSTVAGVLVPGSTVAGVLVPGSTVAGVLVPGSCKLLQEQLERRAHFLLPVLPPACRLGPATLSHLENYKKQERSGTVLPTSCDQTIFASSS